MLTERKQNAQRPTLNIQCPTSGATDLSASPWLGRGLRVAKNELLSLLLRRAAELRVSRTCYQMIVDHAGGLHQRVADR